MQAFAENAAVESETPIVFFVGDPTFAEFREAFVKLNQIVAMRTFKTLGEATMAVESGVFPPSVLIVAQDRPSRRPFDAYERWSQASPISRVVLLLGSWCDGELRTGRPWPGATRIHWMQFDSAAAKKLLQAAGTPSAERSLPVTTTEEERILLQSQLAASKKDSMSASASAIVIAGRNRASTRCLADACRSAGFVTVERKQHDSSRILGAKAVLLDCNSVDQETLTEIDRFARTIPDAPLFVTANFPRFEDCEAAKKRGATAVISKPLRLVQLIEKLDA